jgi:hypothetical protein
MYTPQTQKFTGSPDTILGSFEVTS